MTANDVLSSEKKKSQEEQQERVDNINPPQTPSGLQSDSSVKLQQNLNGFLHGDLKVGLGPLPMQPSGPNLIFPLQQQLLLAAAAAAANQINTPMNTSFQVQPCHSQQAISYQQAVAAMTAGMQVTHNLIPEHLQAYAMAASLNGTPGHQPALILPGTTTPPVMAPSPTISTTPTPPILTVQDRPFVPPLYNGVNVNYPGVRMLHASPPVYVVDNFLTPFECDFLIAAASDSWTPAPVVGKGAGEISASRTSSTCYLAREDLPDYMRKVSLLTGKPVNHCELPQVGRYLPSQQYLQVSNLYHHQQQTKKAKTEGYSQPLSHILT